MEKIFIVENENVFEKYKVTYERAKLIGLMEEILEKCCISSLKTVHRTEAPASDATTWVRMVHKGKKVGIHENGTFGDETIYEYSYVEYTLSHLMIAIQNLVNGESFDRESLFFLKETVSPVDILRGKVEMLSEEINQIDNFETEKKIKKLIELQELIRLLKRNEKLLPESKYAGLIRQYVQEELLETLEKKEIERINSFFAPATNYPVLDLGLSKKMILPSKK